MKAIIVAAGMGRRLLPLTEDIPKCMIKVHGRPLLERAIETLKNSGISEIGVIRGYRAAAISYPNIETFENDHFEKNNILHSLLCARPMLEAAIRTDSPVLVCYSDIIFKRLLVEQLAQETHEVTVLVDLDWKRNYKNRRLHPLSEAENASGNGGKILSIGKGISQTDAKRHEWLGEFVGMFKLNVSGTVRFLSLFDQLNHKLNDQTPFQSAKEWQKAYVTDFFQEMINQNFTVHASFVRGGWQEIDTLEDLNRAHEIWSDHPHNKERSL